MELVISTMQQTFAFLLKVLLDFFEKSIYFFNNLGHLKSFHLVGGEGGVKAYQQSAQRADLP